MKELIILVIFILHLVGYTLCIESQNIELQNLTQNYYPDQRNLQQKSCQKGTYFDIYFNDCILCDPECKLGCHTNPHTCINEECNNRYIRRNGPWQCVPNCFEKNKNPNIFYPRTCYDDCGKKSCNCKKDVCISCKEETTNNAIFKEYNVCQICQVENGWYIYKESEQNYCERCHHTCKTCSGNGLNQCKSCVSPLYLQGTECKLTCDNGFYPKDNKCIKCDENCESCFFDQINQIPACTKCKPLKFLKNKQCIDCNENGFYQSNDGNCLACTPQLNCLSCKNENSCSSCDNNKYLQNNKCVADCGQNQYGFNRECLPCKQGCGSCNNQNTCITCQPNLYLTEDNLCSDCRIDGYYKDEEEKKCKKCDEKMQCSTCEKNKCSSCQPNMDLYIQSEGFCNICDKSKGFYVKDNIFCQQCPKEFNCKTCIYDNNILKCDSCNGNDNVQADSGKCSQCSSNQFLDKQTNQCKDCDPRCKSCSEQSTKCTLCQDQKLFANQKGECVQCDQPGFYKQDGQCLNCDKNCKTCEDGQQCKSCIDGLYFNEKDGTCSLCLQEGYFKEVNLCKECDSSFNCQTCSNSSSCDLCKENFFKDQETNRCVICDDNKYYQDNKDCKLCNSNLNCQKCINDQKCETCKENYFMMNDGTCSLCLDGFFRQSEFCQPCTKEQNCKTCLNSQQCETCDKVHFFMNQLGACIECNNPGEYKTEDGQCLPCNQLLQCQKCLNNSSCESCKDGFNELMLGDKLTCVEKCPEGFFIEGKKCMECKQFLKNCNSCLNKTTCLRCEQQEGFFLSSENKCESCPENCQICNNSNTCQKCNQKFFQDSNNNNKCTSCILNCMLCSSQSSCEVCLSGYVIESFESPQSEKDKNKGTCQKCQKDEFTSEEDLKCTKCTIKFDNCKQCNSRICKKCLDGFILNPQTYKCEIQKEEEEPIKPQDINDEDVNETLDITLSSVNSVNVPLQVIGAFSVLGGGSILSFSSQSFQQLGNFVVHKDELKKQGVGKVFVNQFYQYNLFTMIPKTKIFSNDSQNSESNNSNNNQGTQQQTSRLLADYKQVFQEPEFTFNFFESMFYWILALALLLIFFIIIFFVREKANTLRKIHERRTDVLVLFIFLFSNFAFFNVFLTLKNLGEVDMSKASSIISIISLVIYMIIYALTVISHYKTIKLESDEKNTTSSILLTNISQKNYLTKNFWLIFEFKKLLQVMLTVLISNILVSLIFALTFTFSFIMYIAIFKPIESLFKRSLLLVFESLAFSMLLILLIVSQSQNSENSLSIIALCMISAMIIISLILTIVFILQMIISLVVSRNKNKDSSINDIRSSNYTNQTAINRVSEVYEHVREEKSDLGRYGVKQKNNSLNESWIINENL